MNRLLGALVVFAGMLGAAQTAEAQVYQVYYPAPVTTAYYAPAPVYYAPPVETVYYRRPLLGGTVSGWRYNYPATTYVYPSTVTYYPAW